MIAFKEKWWLALNTKNYILPERVGVQKASEFETLGSQKAPTLKIIREKCLDCTGHQSKEVRRCNNSDCPLWPFRFGTNPHRIRRSASHWQKGSMAIGRRSHEHQYQLE
jgi:hypothetical protein